MSSVLDYILADSNDIIIAFEEGERGIKGRIVRDSTWMTYRGYHREKICFLDKRYQGPNPSPGEVWLCIAGHDTRSKHEDELVRLFQGVLFVFPKMMLARGDVEVVCPIRYTKHHERRDLHTLRITRCVYQSERKEYKSHIEVMAPFEKWDDILGYLSICEDEMSRINSAIVSNRGSIYMIGTKLPWPDPKTTQFPAAVKEGRFDGEVFISFEEERPRLVSNDKNFGRILGPKIEVGGNADWIISIIGQPAEVSLEQEQKIEMIWRDLDGQELVKIFSWTELGTFSEDHLEATVVEDDGQVNILYEIRLPVELGGVVHEGIHKVVGENWSCDGNKFEMNWVSLPKWLPDIVRREAFELVQVKPQQEHLTDMYQEVLSRVNFLRDHIRGNGISLQELVEQFVSGNCHSFQHLMRGRRYAEVEIVEEAHRELSELLDKVMDLLNNLQNSARAAVERWTDGETDDLYSEYHARSEKSCPELTQACRDLEVVFDWLLQKKIEVSARCNDYVLRWKEAMAEIDSLREGIEFASSENQADAILKLDEVEKMVSPRSLVDDGNSIDLLNNIEVTIAEIWDLIEGE